MKYGIGYKGSKNKIADKIISVLPSAENFYDLFCGGGAITHCALLSDKYNKVYMNDINSLCTQLFIDGAKGKYRNETKWISRKEFEEKKGIDPYITICWSFGNNCRDYLYGRDLEEKKHAWHNAIFFNDFTLAKELLNVDLSPIAKIENRYEKYLESKKYIKFDDRLQSLESLERLERLQSLERLERLEISNFSYDEVKIKPNSIIYCDIPYKDTNAYGAEKDNFNFDFEKFYKWCENQKELVFISSYSMPEDRFTCVDMYEHRSTLCATANNSVTEKLFMPKEQAKNFIKNGWLF